MTKFLAVMKREYLYRVRSKMFVFMTILGPVMLFVFTIVPGLLFSIKAGDTRLAIVDLTEGRKLSKPVHDALLAEDEDDFKTDTESTSGVLNANARDRVQKTARALRGSFVIEDTSVNGRSLFEIKQELNARIGKNELD